MTKSQLPWPREKPAREDVTPYEIGPACTECGEPTEEQRSAVAEINQKLGLYRLTGNPLFLWQVLGVCMRQNLPVPDGAKPYFCEIEQTLMKAAVRGSDKRIRDEVSNVVIQRNDPAIRGRSIFEDYRLIQKYKAIYDRVCDHLDSHYLSTLEEACDAVAASTGISADQEGVRRIFQRVDAEMDTFSIRARRRERGLGGGTALDDEG